jgi:hypothetical protein
MKIFFTISFSIIITFKLFSQSIDVAESTLKVGGLSEESFYYGFAEGDKIIFNFEEVKGKALKEFEIIELPSSSKFLDYETKKIENKTLNISRTGVYKFRFLNSALAGRICKFKIERVPINESTKNFNTTVFWHEVYDTTYTTEEQRYLIKSDTVISNLTDQVAKVHSQGNLNGNKTTFNFSLPENTICWSYYIGVDQTGKDAYERATKELTSNATPLISNITGYGPLAALALGGISYISQLQAGEDIDYYIVDAANVNLFENGQQFYYVKKGKVINDFSRMITPLKGNYYVCLFNDNAVTGVNVTVKITAIQANQIWETRPIQKIHLAARQEAYLKN